MWHHAFFRGWKERKDSMTDISRHRVEDLSIAVIDDHEVVLEGIRSFLEKSGIRHVEAFTKADDLLVRASCVNFNQFIVDVELPDMDATELIDRLHALQPQSHIIVNTMHEELWVVERMTEKQVDGVIYKSGQLEQLIEAIAAVADGRQYFCAKFRKSQRHIEATSEVLSNREQEVLRCIAQGCSTKQIAQMLFISENTVESHRQKLFRKMHARNMAELVIKAIAEGYIDPAKIER